MESTNKSSVTLTEKRIASAKTLHVICAIIALVLNVIAFAVLAVNVKITEIMFLAFPLVLAVLDIVFFVKVIFSNYRFKYAVNGAILQALAVFLVSVIAFFVMGFLETKNGKVFVDFAMYAMLIVHILQSVATLLTALYATKGMKSFPKVLCVLFTVAFIGGAAIYGRLLLADGFFGQGGYAEYRTIVYSYDAATDSYTAVDVLDGYGNNVVIPHQFNGSHVLKIDCALFAHEEISSVKIAWADNDGCDKQLDFVGVEHLNYINPELELIAPKLYINHLRKELYALSLDNNNTYALDLANHVYPDGINGNEVYISFGYDKETLELIGVENVIDLWVKDKGTELDLKAHTGVEYIQKSNALNTEHLYWCHENLGEQIFKCIVDADGNEISGEITESIVNAKVVFEKLYHIVIEKDNEDADKTPIENTHKYMYTAGSNTPVCEYIITTAANVQSNLDKLPKRNGFTLKLATGDNKHEITDIAEELANLDSKGSNILTVYPVWTLLPPTINNLTADGKTSGHSAVYGSNVVLDSAATSPASDVSIKYEWRYNGQLVASGSKYTLENLYPNDAEFASKNRAGTYTLTVIAGQDGTTALKSEVSQTIEVGFEKKELGFNWVIPNDLVYSASDKPINVSYKDEAQIINRDNITYQLSHSALRNAGTYTVRIELTDTSEKLYKIPASDVNTSVTVTPYPINVDWGSDVSFVYNSENQAPTASIQGLGEDGVISLDVFVFDGGKRVQKKNAGKYTATADTDNTNYKLDGNEIAFEITQRPITVTGWNENTFVYTSFAQRPAVTLLGNVAANDTAETVIGSIIYEGEKTYVGTHTVTATLPASSNYKFESAQMHEFTITPKALTVSITDKTTTYNAKVYTAFTFTSNGVAVNDSIDEILRLEYKGAAAAAINVNADGYEIDANVIPESKYENYTVTLEKGTLTITKKALKVNVTSIIKPYDGKTFGAEDVTFTHEGVADGDDISEILILEYSGTAIGARNYSAFAYTIEASQREGAKYGNYDITVNNATLRINKAPLYVTAIGGEKTYDGTIGKGFSFEVTDGLVPGETVDMLGEPVYSGAATTNSYAGRHVLKVSFASNDITNNYNIIPTDGEYVINKKYLKVTAISGSKVYDASVTRSGFAFEAEGLIETEYFYNLGTPVYSGTATLNSDVGQYVLEVKLPDNNFTRNYDIEYVKGTYTITKRDIIVRVVNGSMTYNGGKPTNLTTANFEIVGVGGERGLQGSDGKTDFGVRFYGAAMDSSDAGTRELRVELSSKDQNNRTFENYNIVSYEYGTYTINKRPLTITAGVNKFMTYTGNKVPESDYSAYFNVKVNPATANEGLISGHTLASLGTVVYTGDATRNYNAGSYALEVTLQNTTDIYKNYDVTCVYATFEIKPKLLIITPTVNNPSRDYDGRIDNSYYGYTVSGLVDGENISHLGTISYGGTAYNAYNAGQYKLSVTFTYGSSIAQNYDITYGNAANFEIKKATLTFEPVVIRPDRIYNADSDNSYYGYNVSGFVNGESVSNIGNVTYGGTAAGAVNAGEYELKVSFDYKSGVPQNYNIVYRNNSGEVKFVINKAPLYVTIDVPNKEYDGNKAEINVSASGLMGGDSVNNIGEFSFGACENASDAGTYTTETTLESTNYYISSKNEATYHIFKKTVKITVNPASKTYDGNAAETSLFSFKAEGLVGNDSEDSLGTPSYGGNAIGKTEVGSYVLTVSLQKHKNYNFTYVPGTLEIKAATAQ